MSKIQNNQNIDIHLYNVPAIYQTLSEERNAYDTRARECAALTLPTIYPLTQDGSKTSSMTIKTPYQGVGAEGVSNLAAKLLMVLMPPNSLFCKLGVPDHVQRQALKDAGGAEALNEVEKVLAQIEISMQSHIEATADRATLYEALLQLIIAGNVLCHFPEDGNSRIYKLPHFVARRDSRGVVREICLREKVTRDALPEEALEEMIRAEELELQTPEQEAQETTKQELDLYTYIRKTNKGWIEWQVVGNLPLEGTKVTYPENGCPWLALRMYREDGSSYGRSYVEAYKGDLKSLEGLSRAVLEAAAISAKVLFLVRPNGTTRVQTLQNALNGSVRVGNADDVTVLQVQKMHDLQTALQKAEDIERRLAKAFLLFDSMRRDAERVPTEEIRALAQEIETGLGGIYSVLSLEFHRPYAHLKRHQLKKGNKIPPLPDESIEISVVAGFEALGRGNERQKLREFLTDIAQAVGPEVLSKHINLSVLFTRFAAADSLNIEGLVRTQEEIAQEAQAMEQKAQQDKMTDATLPVAAKGIADMAANMPPEMMSQLPEMMEGMGGAEGIQGMMEGMPGMGGGIPGMEQQQQTQTPMM